MILAALLLSVSLHPAPTPVDVRLVADEADAALAILELRRAGGTPSARDWDRLFATAGYRALAQRESAMGRPLSDEAFKAFLLSDSTVARTGALAATLDSWKHIDVNAPARRALAYLPAGTPLRATLYLEIKPQPNSFVFAVNGRPGIFLYVDPAKTSAQLENTMAHELHHIGLNAACKDDADSAAPAAVRKTREWMSAFGEGLAMLAAAGGPDINPHALSDSATRARWDRDVGHFNADLATVQNFFFEVLDRRLPDDSLDARGMGFFGVQGPWYTVGWRMAVTVEKTFGRPRLIGVMCDPPAFLATYNQAVRSTHQEAELATWSDSLLRRVR